MKVLVVDDSVVFRTAIKSALSESHEIERLDVAANGKIALEKIKQIEYDAITLDLEMPIMDGMETIQEIRKINKNIAIIIFSAQNLNAANKTLKALELGADDFVQKLQSSQDLNENLKNIREELVPKFTALVKRRKLGTQNQASPNIQTVAPQTQTPKKMVTVDVDNFKSDLIVMGSSTGGPDLLMKMFRDIKKLDVPVLMVQHMPPVFTTQLAQALNKISPMEVKEAVDGEKVLPGHCYLAPGDYHMRVKKMDNSLYIKLDQAPKVCFVRPAVDCLFESVANMFDGKVAAVILTGMGNDGADGCVKLKGKNSVVMIQDEESAVVWGMPGAVHQKQCFDKIASPQKIVELINKVGSL